MTTPSSTGVEKIHLDFLQLPLTQSWAGYAWVGGSEEKTDLGINSGILIGPLPCARHWRFRAKAGKVPGLLLLTFQVGRRQIIAQPLLLGPQAKRKGIKNENPNTVL